ncbi:MAG: hypothetical protein ACRDSZ_00870 [Pseudonocardiaceae bacterium]
MFRADPDLTDEEIQQRVELRLGRCKILDRARDGAPRSPSGSARPPAPL